MCKKMRMKVFSFFLCLAVLLSVGITVKAADEVNEAYWTINNSETPLEKLDLLTGQSQVIRLKAEIPDDKTLMAYSLEITYDTAKMEVQSAVKDPENVIGTSFISTNTPGTIKTNGFNTSGIDGAGVLSLIELTIKSLSDAPFGIIVKFTAFGASTEDTFIPAVESLNINTNIIDGWVNIQGNVLYKENIPLCTMVLANGQHMFTCNENEGKYNLFVPLDEKGQITLFCFCDGRSPFKVVLEPWQAVNYDVYMVDASVYDRDMTVTALFSSVGVVNPGWMKISGTVTLDGTPLCTMILANGQYMFTCGDNNGKYTLEIPLDSNGQVTLFGFCDGLKPYRVTLTP